MLLTNEQLPARLTRFIGRSGEKAELARLLQTERLITVTGPGGVGKSRLALELARDSGHLFPDGSSFADFARIVESSAVIRTLADALDICESAGLTMLESITAALSGRRAMLVLDNCEHVLDGVVEIVPAMVERCPEVVLVATCRQPLGLEGEAVLRLQGLACPDDGAASLDGSEALQLFLDRARLASPASRWQADELAAAAAICRALEGIPLALELAAAHVNAIPLAELAARLRESMSLLGRPAAAASSRHETLWSTMEWSYRLLSAEESALLRCLSVFRGGATVEAIEAVCAGDTVPRTSVGRLLLSLSEKSLVLPLQTERGARYRLLEPVRQYGRERLEDLGEASAVEARHARYFADLAEKAEMLLRGSQQVETVWRLEAEHDNLRAALAGSLGGSGDAEQGARIVAALGRFWLIRGHFTEGVRWANDYLALMPPAYPLLGRVLRTAGMLCFGLGKHQDAISFMQRSVEAERARGDKRALAESLLALGTAYEAGDRPEEARAVSAEASELIPPEDAWLRAQMHRIDAHAEKLEMGDIACVEGLHEKEYAAARQTGDDVMIANVLNCLAECRRWQGDYAHARIMYDESLGRRLALGDRLGSIQSYLNLGLLAIEQGDIAGAESALGQALRISQQIGDNRNVRIVLLGFAGIAAGHRRMAQAARFLGASIAERPKGRLPDATDQRVFDLIAAECRRQLGDDAFELSQQAGFVLSLDVAVSEARKLIADLEVQGASQTEEAAGPLTARETEVLQLLAAGLSNREIAGRLVLSVRTVETHVAHIFEKLGLSTRVQATAYAIEHGLGPAASVSTRNQ